MAKKIGNMIGIEWALSQLDEQPVQPDEFTVEMLYNESRAAGKTQTLAAVRGWLCRNRASGELTSRTITIAGKRVSVYKRAGIR